MAGALYPEDEAAPYRLPSEAEREYATRAGTETPYFWGEQEGAACLFANGADRSTVEIGPEWSRSDCDDASIHTAAVGSYRQNGFGLFDLSGNVWEWTKDCWRDTYDGAPDDGSARLEGNGGDCSARVLRGGSWVVQPVNLRSAFRSNSARDLRFSYAGFRLARTLTP